MLWVLAAALVPAMTMTARGDDAKAEADLKKMQGTWVQGGTGPDARWVIEADTLKATVNGEEYTCTIKLEPDAKPHPSADLTIKRGPGESPGKTSKAIYKFDGETLVFCVTRPGAEKRPAEYKEVEDEAYLFELKKEAK
jgi:uncharacterized protein (TIGR03067 family)